MDYAEACGQLEDEMSSAASRAESNGLTPAEVVEEVARFLHALRAEL